MMTPAFGPFGSHMSRRAPVPRWAEDMATAVNVCLLRAWTKGEHDERPTRGDIKEWGATTLAELDRVDALVRERSAELARACEERDETLDALAAERAAHDADVVQLGDERDAARRESDRYLRDAAEATDRAEQLGRKLRAAHCERDRARHFECEHGVRVTVHPHGPGGVASNDVDV